MKYLKPYNNINESIKDFLKPKSNEEIEKSIKKIVDDHINRWGNIDYNFFIDSCEHGLINSVLYCLQNDPTNKINQSVINWGLSRASYSGHLDIVKYLIEEKDADIHYRNDTAFRNACEGGYVEMVKYLIDKGTNIYVNNSEYLKWRLKGFRYPDPNKEKILKILQEQDRLNKLNKMNE